MWHIFQKEAFVNQTGALQEGFLFLFHVKLCKQVCLMPAGISTPFTSDKGELGESLAQ
jgi:hypothetical protein